MRRDMVFSVVGRYDLDLNNVNFISVDNVAASAPNDRAGEDARGAALIINPNNANITSNVLSLAAASSRIALSGAREVMQTVAMMVRMLEMPTVRLYMQIEPI